MRKHSRSRIVVLAALMLGLWAGSASAHHSPNHSANLVAIRGELELSTRYLTLAMNQLMHPDQAIALSWEAYVQLRSAHAKVQNLTGGKFPNPLIEQASTMLQSAREHLLQGRSKLGNPDRVIEGLPVQVATNEFLETLRLIELVLYTAF